MCKKAALHNLGCKVNAYETEAMRQLLIDAGYEIVDFAPGADVYVINTCTVTNIADRKSRQMLHRAKKMNPDAIVVATGCYVQTAQHPVLEDPAVDLVLPNNQKSRLIEEIDRFEKKKKGEELPLDLKEGSDDENACENLCVKRAEAHTRAYIKVQDGCNQFCSYCIIPYARGRVRSRETDDVFQEVQRIAENGCREIVLTGIHLSSYGTDLGTSLLDLIRKVHEIPGISRIRLGSLEPTIITETFAEALGEMPKICPHFHLSLQSGCDTVLKRMNRHYTTKEYEEKCEILREHFDMPAITTDVIAGFPGETDEEFLCTLDFLKKIHLYETHIFKYSSRRGTRAASMSDQIPDKIKSDRSDALIALGEENRTLFEKASLKRKAEVLLEETKNVNGAEFWVGYTKEYIRAAVPFKDDAENELVSGKLFDFVEPHLMLLKMS